MSDLRTTASLLHGRACFLSSVPGNGMSVLEGEIYQALRDVQRETAKECARLARLHHALHCKANENRYFNCGMSIETDILKRFPEGK